MFTNPVDPRLLSYFRTTVEVGNITRAAEALHIAQPTLSKALKLLESRLGVLLLERSAHGVAPTAIGERLMRHARLVAAQLGDALAEIDALREGEAGRVRVGAGPSWVRRVLPEAVAALLDAAPDIEVSVTTGFDQSLLDGLELGELDFVVAERPLGGEDCDLDYRPLTSDRLVVCARDTHPLIVRGAPVALEEALGARWALPGERTLARRKLAGRLAQLGVAQPRRVLTSSSISFLLSFALRTDALVYTTRSMLRTPEARGLSEIDLPAFASEREAGVILRAGALLSPAAAALVERLEAYCADDPRN